MGSKHFLQTRNRRKTKGKSRRASKRSRRIRRNSRRSKQRGGSWAYRIPDEAVVGRTSDEGVEGFKTMKEVREEDLW